MALMVEKKTKQTPDCYFMPFTMDETSLIGQLNFSLSADLSHLMFSTRQKLVQWLPDINCRIQKDKTTMDINEARDDEV